MKRAFIIALIPVIMMFTVLITSGKFKTNQIKETMKTQTNNIDTVYKVIHRAETRGHANHGWLDSWHTFSFANYYDEDRMNFGLLRVLNDDIVAPGMGFGKHPHSNMEIISIPLKGALEHSDSEGNKHVIKEGDVQIMSAGSGITHAEYNHSKTESANFLQIWVFPKQHNIKPRYEQKSFPEAQRRNRFQIVISPDDPEALWINQNARFALASLDAGSNIDYGIKSKNNGVYIFMLSGKVETSGETLNKRDGLGVAGIDKVSFTAKENSEMLIIEVPMQ